jgi:hypothetical protein
MKIPSHLFAIAIILSLARSAGLAQMKTADYIARDAIISAEGIVLTSKDRLSTPGTFQPPVEITIVAKTDSTNLRIAYAADQVIFNWERDGQQLRIDGGPAAGKNKPEGGAIPTDQYVAIRWVVTAKRQAIYVDNELRYEHRGDYSHIDNCVSVFSALGSKVTVKSIQVRRLPTDAK